METKEIFDHLVSQHCDGCGRWKLRRSAFCRDCYRQLPPALRSSLWKKFGAGFEEAYHGALSWFREHPLQGAHRAQQKKLFGEDDHA